jgi:hypothetical protein
MSIINICQQKQRRQLLNVPPYRFTPQSPYPQYTVFDLDMRRKAEILKYQNTQSNSKTNNQTKAQRFAQIVKNPFKISSFSTPTDLVCPSVPLPSSSSDVPGPTILLYEDPSIPLYNFQSSIVRSYGIQNSENPIEPWNIYIQPDISFNNLTNLPYYPFFSIMFTSASESGEHEFILECPVQLTIQGYSTTSSLISMSISTFYIDVYYNTTLMATSDPALVSQALSSTLILFKLDNLDSSFQLLVQFQTTANQPFSITYYAGVLTAYNMTFLTNPGFIYDVRIRSTLSISPTSPHITTTVFMNASNSNTIVSGCTLLTPPSTNINQLFTFKEQGNGENTTDPYITDLAFYSPSQLNQLPAHQLQNLLAFSAEEYTNQYRVAISGDKLLQAILSPEQITGLLTNPYLDYTITSYLNGTVSTIDKIMDFPLFTVRFGELLNIRYFKTPDDVFLSNSFNIIVNNINTDNLPIIISGNNPIDLSTNEIYFPNCTLNRTSATTNIELILADANSSAVYKSFPMRCSPLVYVNDIFEYTMCLPSGRLPFFTNGRTYKLNTTTGSTLSTCVCNFVSNTTTSGTATNVVLPFTNIQFTTSQTVVLRILDLSNNVVPLGATFFFYIVPFTTSMYTFIIRDTERNEVAMSGKIEVLNSFVAHVWNDINPSLDILANNGVFSSDCIFNSSIPNFTFGGVNISSFPYYSDLGDPSTLFSLSQSGDNSLNANVYSLVLNAGVYEVYDIYNIQITFSRIN